MFEDKQDKFVANFYLYFPTSKPVVHIVSGFLLVIENLNDKGTKLSIHTSQLTTYFQTINKKQTNFSVSENVFIQHYDNFMMKETLILIFSVVIDRA